MKRKFDGTVLKGKLEIRDKESFLLHLSKLENKNVEITCEETKLARSGQQNKYYWAVVLKVIGDELGNSPEEMHEIFKQKFLGKTIEFLNKKSGEVESVTIGESTALKNTKEFSEYIEKIVRFASIELGIYVPSANEFI